MTDVHVVSSPALEARSAAGLRRLNVLVGYAHAVQAIVLLILAADASLPVTASFLAGPPGAGDYGSAGLGSLRIDWLVAAFLLLAAIDHLLMAMPGVNGWYMRMLGEERNDARWIEYSVSSSLM